MRTIDYINQRIEFLNTQLLKLNAEKFITESEYIQLVKLEYILKLKELSELKQKIERREVE